MIKINSIPLFPNKETYPYALGPNQALLGGCKHVFALIDVNKMNGMCCLPNCSKPIKAVYVAESTYNFLYQRLLSENNKKFVDDNKVEKKVKFNKSKYPGPSGDFELQMGSSCTPDDLYMCFVPKIDQKPLISIFYVSLDSDKRPSLWVHFDCAFEQLTYIFKYTGFQLQRNPEITDDRQIRLEFRGDCARKMLRIIVLNNAVQTKYYDFLTKLFYSGSMLFADDFKALQ